MAASFLVLDVGNTSVGVGYGEGPRLARSFYITSDAARTPDEYGVLLAGLLERAGVEVRRPLPSLVCSVVPALDEIFASALTSYFGAAPAFVGPDYAALGVDVRYDNPAEVGPDRVVNALAARELYGAPAIVVDFGTATTFDVVNGAGAYVGGVIAPGVALSARTLFARTARLGAVAFTLPPRVVGRNTDEALRTGIVLGAARAADGIVAAIRAEQGEVGALVATGGLAAVVAPVMDSGPVLDAELTLKGLVLAFERLGRGGTGNER